ncbi:S9 family peptidase [Aquisediminimonas sediminicola]|uniref:S9 family peptidase n=1 Tax=Alteraquisediminimonas sediminicola TaxID=2676787 RepID=UPI001C8D0356|nr:S9 family peptidase [Aquisediminimonas sediminicola]
MADPAPLTPPIAATRPHQSVHHGRIIDDPWAWLRDPNYPDVNDGQVIAHLEAENRWFEAQMAPHQPLIDSLFEEMKARLNEDESSVPYRDGGWLYHWAFAPGTQYRRWFRAAVDGGAAVCILDENAQAHGKDFFRLGALVVSPDGMKLAWTCDDSGAERFTLRIRDLATGQDSATVIPGLLGGVVWSAQSDAVLYGLVNDHWRIDRIMRHRLGDDPAQDRLVYQETDERFQAGVGRTQSRRFLTLSTGNHETSECWLIPADDVDAAPILVSPRVDGRQYEVEEHDNTLFIRTNDAHVNFRIVTASLDAPGVWQEWLAGSERIYLQDITCFADQMVLQGREQGLDQIWITGYAAPDLAPIAFPEASYTAGLGSNPEYRVGTLRIGYQSMVTPATVFDYDLATGALDTLKVQTIPSGYDARQYRTERVMIEARDGKMIPASIVYRTDYPKDGSQPLHLYGYGAYGIAIPPGFSTVRLSLLDRGFAYAIAHIRGGDDLGYQYYLDGKLEKRTNSFNDFVDVTKGLIARGFGAAGKVSISGGSAGGELMGAVINQAPALYGAVVAHVPFVDVLNTMLDASLPLTPGEWPEWGNPIEDAAAFDLIRSYSPYDNVTAQAYPPMLVTAGLHDPRVTYWEPAKWVAKLRVTKTDDNALLLKTNMAAGHGGKSGRYESLHEDAEEQAFILTQLAG